MIRVHTFIGIAAAVTLLSLEPAEPTVVSVEVDTPAPTIRRTVRHWRVPAHPAGKNLARSHAFMHLVMREERKRWGGPSLHNRLHCESNGAWWDRNEQTATGYAQFLDSTWADMWPGTPRLVVYTTRRRAWRRVWERTTYSDGTTKARVIGRRRVTVRTRRKGWIPKGASAFHGWANIRTAQRAVAGYKTTSWVCGL